MTGPWIGLLTGRLDVFLNLKTEASKAACRIGLRSDPQLGPEGCLSFPEMYADISRPEAVEVKALNEKGKTIVFRCGGLLARAIQHEADHLNGILFIDRMSVAAKKELKPELEALQSKTKEALRAARKS